jgi:hypothetical protein
MRRHREVNAPWMLIFQALDLDLRQVCAEEVRVLGCQSKRTIFNCLPS